MNSGGNFGCQETPVRLVTLREALPFPHLPRAFSGERANGWGMAGVWRPEYDRFTRSGQPRTCAQSLLIVLNPVIVLNRFPIVIHFNRFQLFIDRLISYICVSINVNHS